MLRRFAGSVKEAKAVQESKAFALMAVKLLGRLIAFKAMQEEKARCSMLVTESKPFTVVRAMHSVKRSEDKESTLPPKSMLTRAWQPLKAFEPTTRTVEGRLTAVRAKFEKTEGLIFLKG